MFTIMMTLNLDIILIHSSNHAQPLLYKRF